MASKPYKERHYNWVTIFRDAGKDNLFNDKFKKEIGGRNSLYYLENAFKECGSKDIVDMVMSTDIMTNLLDDLLVKMDIATMANSLEGRSPFLDHKVMEFAASLPSHFKLKGLKTKYFLKRAFLGFLPKEILNRPKMGFGVPLDRWFREELREMAYDVLLNRRAIERGYFQSKWIEDLLDTHAQKKADHSYRIWSLLILELWHRQFIDG